MATSSNRLSNRSWGRLWGPFPSNASLGRDFGFGFGFGFGCDFGSLPFGAGTVPPPNIYPCITVVHVTPHAPVPDGEGLYSPVPWHIVMGERGRG